MKIAFVDSGIGGLSVVAKTYEKKSGEFFYYADSDYMPYGALTETVLKDHLAKVTEKLLKADAKVIVLACNTATAVAIDYLRERYKEIAFVGTEPALKPALCFDGNILVLATPLTLKQKRFLRLTEEGKRQVIAPDCSRLAYLIEKDYPDLTAAKRFLDNAVAPYLDCGIGAVVIGCTHYAYLEDYIQKKYRLRTVSGSAGVVRQLCRVAPEECFGDENLLRVKSGEESGQKLLEERAKFVCGVEVAPF